MSKTLNDYLELLNATQQEMIVFCVQRFSDRGDEFHRGLLPFLPAEEAARCLLFHLETLKQAQNVSDLTEVGKAVIGEKYLKQIISVFRSALVYRASDLEKSEVIHLNSVKLKRGYGKRFANKFCLRLTDLGINRKKPIEGLYEMQMISRNMWKVTGHKEYHDAVIQYLSDYYGQ
jgi:hypothetical protein